MGDEMKIGVIGLGKLGLPLAALLANSGHEILCFDSNELHFNSLRNHNFLSSEPGLMDVLNISKNNFIYASSIEEVTEGSLLIFVIVPTPSLPSGHFSNLNLENVLTKIGKACKKKDSPLVVDIVSTVMPGSCDSIFTKILEKESGKSIGQELGLCYNPEFIALGSVLNDMQNPDMHLIGESEAWAGDLVETALNSIVTKETPTRRMALKEAELVKIAVNNFVTMKISYANALFEAANVMGEIDIDIVTDAIGLDKRIGHRYLKGAAPYGGPCFPRDTRALSALYREIGVPDFLSNATEKVNEKHVEFIAKLVESNLKSDEKIGLVGISYKAGTPVIDESPGVAIAQFLLTRGYEVTTFDDEGSVVPTTHPNYHFTTSIDELIARSDLIVVTRPINDKEALFKKLIASNVRYLDVWRQG